MIKITLINYAYFLEVLGKESLVIVTEAKTAGQLFTSLDKEHNFSYDLEICKVAINDELCSWETCLQENDKVVFLSPFSGG